MPTLTWGPGMTDAPLSVTLEGSLCPRWPRDACGMTGHVVCHPVGVSLGPLAQREEQVVHAHRPML